MNEIELTAQERLAAASALSGFMNASVAGFALTDALDAINKLRRGDPPGSVRVKGNRVAVRMAGKPYLQDRDDVPWWRIVDAGSEHIGYGGQVAVESWELVHKGGS